MKTTIDTTELEELRKMAAAVAELIGSPISGTLRRYTAVWGPKDNPIVSVGAADLEEAKEKITEQLDRPGRREFLQTWQNDGARVICRDGAIIQTVFEFRIAVQGASWEDVDVITMLVPGPSASADTFAAAVARALSDAHRGIEVRWNREAPGSLGMGHYVGSWPEVAAIKRLAEDHMPAAKTADKQVEPVGPVVTIHPAGD